MVRSYLILSHSRLEDEAPAFEVSLRGHVSRDVVDTVTDALEALEEQWAHLRGQLPRLRLLEGSWGFRTVCSSEFHGEVLLLGFVVPIEKAGFTLIPQTSPLNASFRSAQGTTLLFEQSGEVKTCGSVVVGGNFKVVHVSEDMALQVQPHTRVNLSRATDMRLFFVGVGWDVSLSRTEVMMQGANYTPPDLDIEIGLFDGFGVLLEALTPKGLRTSSDGAVRLTADSSGESVGDDERFLVDPFRLSRDVHSITVCIRLIATAKSKITFRDVRNCYVRMVSISSRAETELWRFRLDPSKCGRGRQAYMCRIARCSRSEWSVLTLHGNDGYSGGSQPAADTIRPENNLPTGRALSTSAFPTTSTRAAVFSAVNPRRGAGPTLEPALPANARVCLGFGFSDLKAPPGVITVTAHILDLQGCPVERRVYRASRSTVHASKPLPRGIKPAAAARIAATEAVARQQQLNAAAKELKSIGVYVCTDSRFLARDTVRVIVDPSKFVPDRHRSLLLTASSSQGSGRIYVRFIGVQGAMEHTIGSLCGEGRHSVHFSGGSLVMSDARSFRQNVAPKLAPDYAKLPPLTYRGLSKGLTFGVGPYTYAGGAMAVYLTAFNPFGELLGSMKLEPPIAAGRSATETTIASGKIVPMQEPNFSLRAAVESRRDFFGDTEGIRGDMLRVVVLDPPMGSQCKRPSTMVVTAVFFYPPMYKIVKRRNLPPVDQEIRRKGYSGYIRLVGSESPGFFDRAVDAKAAGKEAAAGLPVALSRMASNQIVAGDSKNRRATARPIRVDMIAGDPNENADVMFGMHAFKVTYPETGGHVVSILGEKCLPPDAGQFNLPYMLGGTEAAKAQYIVGLKKALKRNVRVDWRPRVDMKSIIAPDIRIKYPVVITVSNMSAFIPACDKGGTSDPYVLFRFFKGKDKAGAPEIARTDVLEKVSCPAKIQFSDFKFTVDTGKAPMYASNARSISISCYDKDRWSKDDVIFKHIIDLSAVSWTRTGEAFLRGVKPNRRVKWDESIRSNAQWNTNTSSKDKGTDAIRLNLDLAIGVIAEL